MGLGRACALAAVLVGALALEAAGGVAERAQDLPTRAGVRQRFLLLTPDDPVGSLILFAGGHGHIALSPEGCIGWGAQNFLVRTRRRFAEAGFVVAVLDVASDFKRSAAMGDYRLTPEHAQDVKTVIAHVRAIKAPVWLVGTSMGTLSAANAASRLTEGGPDGLVLTSSVTREPGRGARSVRDVSLEDIRIPTLVVHNRDDECRVTPFADVEALKGWLKQAPKGEILAVAGGDRPRSDPCEAMSYHGFLGLEAQVVRAITDWIKAAQGVGK